MLSCVLPGEESQAVIVFSSGCFECRSPLLLVEGEAETAVAVAEADARLAALADLAVLQPVCVGKIAMLDALDTKRERSRRSGKWGSRSGENRKGAEKVEQQPRAHLNKC